MRPIALVLFLASTAMADDREFTKVTEDCSVKQPVCLYSALTEPEFAFLLGTKMATLPEFKRDGHAFISGGDKDALVMRWRKRVKSEASRKLESMDGQKLAKMYFTARLVMIGNSSEIFPAAVAEIRRLDAKPERAAESLALKERLRVIREHMGSLSLDDVTGLAVAADASQQTDYLGRWIKDCLRPAGGLLPVARSRLAACKSALGGLPPVANAAR